MLDTARHFIPVKMILRVLRQMAMCKLNVFHWHITDAVSFPLSLKTRPELASKGAFSSRQIYSSEDVRHIVEFAQKLHIRVVPEVDTPAHAASWMRAFPHIGINCSWIVPDDPLQKNNAYKRLDVLTLHPTSAETREVVDDVLRDVTEMFPDRFVHIGADEMNHRCWSEDTSTMKTLRSMSLNPKIAERKFLQKNIETLSKYSKRTIVWQEAFDSSNLRDDVVVMTWKCWGSPMTVGDRSMSRVLASGLSVIQTQCWYLDWDSNWQTMYRQYVDPRSLGGEAAMWTERVDFTNLECRLWPRTFVVAERLWSEKVEMEKEFSYRLDYQTSTLKLWIDDNLTASSTTPVQESCPLLESQSIQRDMDVFSRFIESQGIKGKKLGHDEL